MAKIPKFAIRDGKHRVQVLQYQGNNHFDVLETVGSGRARYERRLLIHGSRLQFLKDPKPPNGSTGQPPSNNPS